MREGGTARQMMGWVVVALLSPAIRLMPSQTAQWGGWLTTVITLPIAVGTGWCLGAISHNLTAGMSAGVGSDKRLVRLGAKALALLYTGWGLVLLTTYLSLAGVRLLTTGYESTPLIFSVTVLIGTVGWLVSKGLPTILRTGQIFFLVLTGVVVFTLVFSLPQIKAVNLLPLWVDDLYGGVVGSYYPLGILGFLVYAGWSMGGTTFNKGDGRRCGLWMAGLWVALTMIQLAVVGTFGGELTATMETPFFFLARGLSLTGVFERVEAVVVALWVVSDLTFLTLLTYGTYQSFGCAVNGRNPKGGHWWMVAVAWVGALWLGVDKGRLIWLEYTGIPLGNVVVGLVIPLIIGIICLIRKKLKKGVDKGGNLWYTN